MLYFDDNIKKNTSPDWYAVIHTRIFIAFVINYRSCNPLLEQWYVSQTISVVYLQLSLKVLLLCAIATAEKQWKLTGSVMINNCTVWQNKGHKVTWYSKWVWLKFRIDMYLLNWLVDIHDRKWNVPDNNKERLRRVSKNCSESNFGGNLVDSYLSY